LPHRVRAAVTASSRRRGKGRRITNAAQFSARRAGFAPTIAAIAPRDLLHDSNFGYPGETPKAELTERRGA